MGTPPDALLRLVDRFSQDQKVFLSGDYKEEQLPKAKTPHEPLAAAADSLRLAVDGDNDAVLGSKLQSR